MNNEKTMKEVYLLAQEHCGLKVGDLVKVTRKAEDYEAGWNCVWTGIEIDKTIGKIGEISVFLKNSGIEVTFSFGSWLYPYFVLEKVEKPEHVFKPFDRVLVRDNNDRIWRPDIFRYKEANCYLCMTDWWNFCIPYEGNEHLLGTTDMPEGDWNE